MEIIIAVFSVALCFFAFLMFLMWLGIIKTHGTLHHFDKNGIVLKFQNKEKYKSIPWDRIISITLENRKGANNAASLDLVNGENLSFMLIDSPQDNLAKLNSVFLSSLKGSKSESVTYRHPKRFTRRKKLVVFLLLSVSVAFLIQRFLLYAQNLSRDGEGLSFFMAPIVALAVSTITTIYIYKKRNLYLSTLTLSPNKMKCKDEFGREFTKAFDEVSDFKLDALDAYIEYNDGIKIRCLEKMSFWPLLREQLISKLQSS